MPTGIIDPHVALAIMDVEAGGDGFGQESKLKIRFEAPVFRQRLANEQKFHEYFMIADSRPWAEPQFYRRSQVEDWSPIHTGRQASEWGALEVAQSLDTAAALESTSMGIAQIMGFHYQRIGYARASEMFDDFEDGEAAQIVGFLNYILSDPALIQAVKARDWREIARLYNGAGNVDVYAPLLEKAYRRRVAV